MNLIQNHSKQKYFGKKWIQIGTEINNEPKHKLCDFTLYLENTVTNMQYK